MYSQSICIEYNNVSVDVINCKYILFANKANINRVEDFCNMITASVQDQYSWDEILVYSKINSEY